MMLQVDGSPHDWLQGRGPPMCLIGAIDDATSKVTGGFFTQAESSWGYFTLFSEIFNAHGLPHSLYTDCHSVFWTDREPTLQEQLINQKPTTEVGRALEELGVTLILAHSPQAKGRIERLWNTFQDRLVSELRLAKAKTLEQAQAVLERYIAVHNRKFAKPARAEPAWRKAQRAADRTSFVFQATPYCSPGQHDYFRRDGLSDPQDFSLSFLRKPQSPSARVTRWCSGDLLQDREDRGL